MGSASGLAPLTSYPFGPASPFKTAGKRILDIVLPELNDVRTLHLDGGVHARSGDEAVYLGGKLDTPASQVSLPVLT